MTADRGRTFQKLSRARSRVSAIWKSVSSLVSSNSVLRSSLRFARRSSPPCSRIFLESETRTPSPELSMYPVWLKSIRNLRSPFSNSSSTFCFNSWRLPTMSCPSTSTTTISPCFLIEKLMCGSPERSRLNQPSCRRGLQCGDGGDIDNVIGGGAAREIGAGSRQPLENRADGARASEPFDELVADIAGVQRRKDEDVRASSDGAARSLTQTHRCDERSITLQFSVHRQGWIAATDLVQRLAHLFHRRTGTAAFRAEREQRNTRLVPDNP